jgi:hypothetical protein
MTDTTVIRVSRGTFDPARFPDAEAMTHATGEFLIPAIRRLDGLLGYYAGTHPSGSTVHVSLWRSDADAQQMSRLKEMIVDARAAGDAAGVTFEPIVNYPIAWRI